jgi:hypothetical protein
VARSSARLAVVTDAHANLPALRAALAAIRAEGCDAVLHLNVASFVRYILDYRAPPPLVRTTRRRRGRGARRART